MVPGPWKATPPGSTCRRSECFVRVGSNTWVPNLQTPCQKDRADAPANAAKLDLAVFVAGIGNRVAVITRFVGFDRTIPADGRYGLLKSEIVNQTRRVDNGISLIKHLNLERKRARDRQSCVCGYIKLDGGQPGPANELLRNGDSRWKSTRTCRNR